MDGHLAASFKLQGSSGPGINFVCSSCGALLYHTGRHGAFEGGEVGFPSRQPYEVAERLKSCPECAHQLNSASDPTPSESSQQNERFYADAKILDYGAVPRVYLHITSVLLRQHVSPQVPSPIR